MLFMFMIDRVFVFEFYIFLLLLAGHKNTEV